MNKIIMIAASILCSYFSMAQTLSNGEYFIKVNRTGKYLAITGASKDNGARLVQWDNEYSTHFRFILTHLGNGIYTLKAKQSGKYISTEGAATQGAKLIQWDWQNQDNQKWYIRAHAGGRGYLLICVQNNMKTIMQNWGATTDQPKNGSYLFLSNALPQDMILDFKKNETSAIESSKKPNSEKLIIKTKKRVN